MKIIVRPILNPNREIDVTHRLVATIAEELWRLFGGNDTLNWIEAEWHLQQTLAQGLVQPHETPVARIAPSVNHVPSNPAMRRSAGAVRRERSDSGAVRLPHTADRRNRTAHSVETKADWK